MVKRVLLLAMCVIALSIGSSAIAAPTISIEKVATNPGATGVIVKVLLNNEAPALSAVSISIDFDKVALTWKSGTVDMGTWAQPASVGLSSSPHATNTLGGQIDISGLNYDQAIAANTGGTFATIIFDIPVGTAPAKYPLKIMTTATPPITEVLDVNLANVSMTWVDGEIDVQSQGTTTTTTAPVTTTTAPVTTTTAAVTTTTAAVTTTTGAVTTTTGGVTTTTIACTTRIPGDIGGNCGISVFDALQVAKHDVALITLTAEELGRADVDGVTGVDIFDALKIAEMATSDSTNAK